MDEIHVEARETTSLSVLNPMGYPPKITKKSAAERLDTLDGKTVYLVDCRFDDSIDLLKQIKVWFADQMPSVDARIISLNNTYQKDDPETWKEIQREGDAAIVGVGH